MKLHRRNGRHRGDRRLCPSVPGPKAQRAGRQHSALANSRRGTIHRRRVHKGVDVAGGRYWCMGSCVSRAISPAQIKRARKQSAADIVAMSATVDGQVALNIGVRSKINLGARQYPHAVDSLDQPHKTVTRQPLAATRHVAVGHTSLPRMPLPCSS